MWTTDPTLRDVWAARQRIAPYARPTPLEPSLPLFGQVGVGVWLKLETFQPTGSFKLRGAANKILSLDPQAQRRGVITFSTGNHGLAVAYIARQLGVEATVCVSRRADPAKLAAIRQQGARLEVHGESQDEAEAHCYWLAEQRGLTVIKPFDDPEVIAGQGTLALELLEALPQLKAVLVPVSGGGLAAGVGMALKSVDPSIRVVGASMEGGAAMYHSLWRGSPVALPEVNTLADSLQGGIGQDNRYTLALVRRYVDEWVLVSEEAIARGMAFLFGEHRLVVEGAAAVGVAALLEGGLARLSGDVAVILSGRNVDPFRYLKAIEPHLGG
jgi:threonine dehydratase